MERFGFIKQKKGEWVCVKTTNGPFCQYEHVEKALADKDKEIAELKQRVQRKPEEWESVCGECNGSGWR